MGTKGEQMTESKEHLKKIYRTPPERFDRTEFARLDKNENLEDIPSDYLNEILSDIDPVFLSAYPQVYPLYQKLSESLGVDIEYILITAGSDAAIKNIYEVYIEPKDEIILPDPTYAMYYVYADLFQAELVKIPYDNELNLSVDDLIGSITPHTKLIAIANPNSPTGTIISKDELRKVLDKAKRTNSLVLVDEAYYPYYSQTALDLLSEYDNLIITRTFSKAYGLASMRLGYAIASKKIIAELSKFRPIYEATGISVLFGCKILERPGIIEKRVKNVLSGKEYISTEMEKLGFKTFKSYANFIHIRVGSENVNELARFLRKNHVLVKSGFEHECLKDCIRITIGPKELMDKFVELMKQYFGNCSE